VIATENDERAVWPALSSLVAPSEDEEEGETDDRIKKYGRDFVIRGRFDDLLYRSEFGGEEVEKDLEEAAFFRLCLENSGRPGRLRSIIKEHSYIFTMRLVPAYGGKRALDFDLQIYDLESALKFQLFQKLIGQAVLRLCTLCSGWFEVGPGTGRRLDAKFCSDEHRVLFNSRKRNKGG
jgi:hypothetical protein